MESIHCPKWLRFQQQNNRGQNRGCNLANIDIRQLFARQISIYGSYMGAKHELLEVLKLVRAGDLRPVISQVLPLEEAGRGQQVLEDRQHFGKVVLAVL